MTVRIGLRLTDANLANPQLIRIAETRRLDDAGARDAIHLSDELDGVARLDTVRAERATRRRSP